jgi:hypothetical protein
LRKGTLKLKQFSVTRNLLISMRFFLKVSVLVGLIVISKLEKQTTMIASKQADSLSLPVYSQNSDNGPASLPSESGKEIQKISYQFSY